MIDTSQSRTLMMHRITFKNDFSNSESKSFSPCLTISKNELFALFVILKKKMVFAVRNVQQAQDKFLNEESSTGKPLILKKLWCLYLLILVIYLVIVLTTRKITGPRFE